MSDHLPLPVADLINVLIHKSVTSHEAQPDSSLFLNASIETHLLVSVRRDELPSQNVMTGKSRALIVDNLEMILNYVAYYYLNNSLTDTPNPSSHHT